METVVVEKNIYSNFQESAWKVDEEPETITRSISSFCIENGYFAKSVNHTTKGWSFFIS